MLENIAVCLIKVSLIMILLFGNIFDSFQLGEIPKKSKVDFVQPKLFFRYENGTSMFRFIEDFQIIRAPNTEGNVYKAIAIRICSDSQLLPSLPSASINAIRAAEFLAETGGYQPSKIFLLRSDTCKSLLDSRLFATEIWGIDDNLALPPNTESYTYNQITVKSLGFDPVECKEIDYKKAINELIREMKRDENSFGVIIKYYLKETSAVLEKRVAKSKNLLRRSNISHTRYSVTEQHWHDGDSSCANREPRQPMIVFITAHK